jgi:hypothetical protein
VPSLLTTRVLALSSIALGGVLGGAGCSSAPDDPAAQSSAARTASNEAAEKVATRFRENVAALSVVVSACQTPETIGDPACPGQVLAAIRGTGGSIQPRGIIDWNALYRNVLKRIGSSAKASLCSYLDTWKGFNNVYYNRGAAVTAGVVRTWTAGAELVYDIGDRQMAMFTFTGKARGNVAGASAGVYGGFAFSKARHGLFDAWSGSSWGYQASYGIPETKVLGVTGSTFSNPEGDVVGSAIGLSIGFNFLHAWGADGGVFESKYRPWNSGTREFSPAGATLERSGSDVYWSFGSKDDLGSGWWLAFEMIRFELVDVLNATDKYSVYVSHPTWAAALLAIGSEFVRYESASQSIEDWCQGYAYVPNGDGCGLGTASVGPRTCAGGGDAPDDIEAPQITLANPGPGDCSSGGAAACDARFPGQDLVCSTGGQEDSSCCRKPFPITTLCSTDGDCASDEVCVMATAHPVNGRSFGCMKPGTQPCVRDKK